MRLSFAGRLVAWVLGALLSAPALAQPPSAEWLLHTLAAQAEREATQAAGSHRTPDAQTWQAWANLYTQLAQDPRAKELSAAEVARSNVNYCRKRAAQYAQAGAKDAAALFQASTTFWEDLGQQLARGGALTVHFPKAQMLKPIPGLEGTPWAKASAADCQALAARAKACERQVSQMQSQSLTSGSESGDFLTVRRAQCNRAEELYLAHCGK